MLCYASKFKLLGYLALTSVMVGAAYFCTTRTDLTGQIFGWLGIAFFGLGFVVFPIQMLWWGPVIIIDADGIEDRRLGIGLIRWEEIIAMAEYSASGTTFVVLYVRNPEEYVSRMSWWKRKLAAFNQSFGFSPVSIGFTAVTPGIEDALPYMRFCWHDRAVREEEEREEEANQQGQFTPLDP